MITVTSGWRRARSRKSDIVPPLARNAFARAFPDLPCSRCLTPQPPKPPWRPASSLFCRCPAVPQGRINPESKLPHVAIFATIGKMIQSEILRLWKLRRQFKSLILCAWGKPRRTATIAHGWTAKFHRVIAERRDAWQSFWMSRLTLLARCGPKKTGARRGGQPRKKIYSSKNSSAKNHRYQWHQRIVM